MNAQVKRVAVALCLVLGATTGAHGAVWYVTPTGTGDGASWEDAGPLQDVVDAAEEGDEVWVAAGAYTGSGTNVLTMQEGVDVYGGFAGDETDRDQRDWETHETIIDGEEARRCVNGADNAVLDGFTVTRGRADDGGGMLFGTATNCTFIDNTAVWEGGGMSGGTATDCTFTGNTANWDGGGMYEGTATDCTFTDNTAGWAGGGMFLGTAINCTFTSNTAEFFLAAGCFSEQP